MDRFTNTVLTIVMIVGLVVMIMSALAFGTTLGHAFGLW